MKMRANLLLIPAVAFGLGACNKKETAVTPEKAAEVASEVAKAVAPEAKPEAPKVSAEERAAKLGFVKHLPKDTEAVVSFYNGSKVADRVKTSKLWSLVQEQMNGVGGMDMPADDEEMGNEDAEVPEGEQEDAADAAVVENEPSSPDGEPAGPAALFGSEVTVALGKSTGEQLGNLLTFNRRSSYYQMRALAKAFADGVKSGDTSALGSAAVSGYSEELIKEILKDPASGTTLLEKTKMPPIYVAFRTSEADRAAAGQQVSSMLANVNMLGEMVEPFSVEKAGVKLEGSKLLGSKISSTMAEDREDMEETLGSETTDQLLAIVAKKDIVIATGTVGDYVVVFLGGSVDDFSLAAGLGDSLVGSDALAFSDSYISKDIVALTYGQKESMDQILASAGGISEMTDGLRDGLAGAEGIGETRDLEALFQLVAEREAALRKLAVNDASGVVAFFEEGLKVESFGGYDYGMMDWKAANKLAHLGNSEDVVLFANMSSDAGYDEKAHAFVESILETGYALAMKVAEVPAGEGEIAQFQEMAKMFDTKFRPDLVSLWDSFSNDFGGSLGNETAVVMDLKGGAPAIPGIPQPVVDHAKVPRITIISPVTDRAKLSGSWDKMNTTLTGTLAKISEMTGQEIPMQKPISSERGGNTTWFFPMPFFTDDFLPSVTVGDKWFAASTSKNQALDLMTLANTPGETRSGFWFTLNFKALEKYATETHQLIDQNSEALMGGSISADQKKIVNDAISILGDLDKLTVHSRRDGGQLRSSVHFKTR